MPGLFASGAFISEIGLLASWQIFREGGALGEMMRDLLGFASQPSSKMKKIKSARAEVRDLRRREPGMVEDTTDLRGMTVNERLHHLGLMPAFEDAVRSGKLASVVAVLRQAQFSQAQAGHTATAVLADPERYGYKPSFLEHRGGEREDG